MHGETLPVSRALVLALALGFGLFNQILFTVLGHAVIADGNRAAGERLMTIGVIVGAALTVAGVMFLVTTAARRWSDVLAGGLVLAAVVLAVFRGRQDGLPAAAVPLLVANGGLAAWWSRGWLRRVLRRRHESS